MYTLRVKNRNEGKVYGFIRVHSRFDVHVDTGVTFEKVEMDSKEQCDSPTTMKIKSTKVKEDVARRMSEHQRRHTRGTNSLSLSSGARLQFSATGRYTICYFIIFYIHCD